MKSLDKKKQLLIKTKKDKISSKRQCESCQHMGKGECNAFKCIARNYCDWEEIKRPKELDWTDIVKNIFFANGVKCDNEQFLIEDINNLIKEVEEETKKEITDDLGKLMDINRARKLGDNLEIYQGKRECPICGANPEKQREMILSITNKEKQK